MISGSLDDIATSLRLSTMQKEVATSGLNFVAGFGGLFVSGELLDRLGRRTTLILAAMLLVAGAALISTARSFAWLIAGRALQGLGSGATIVATSVYITELAPASLRGSFVALADISINFGILLGYVADYCIKWGLSSSPHLGWRVAMAGSGIMPLFFLCLIHFVPETPRFLVMVNRDEDARIVLTNLCGGPSDNMSQTLRIEAAVDRIMDPLIASREINSNKTQPTWSEVLLPKGLADRKIVWVAIFIATSQQFTGTEAILYCK